MENDEADYIKSLDKEDVDAIKWYSDDFKLPDKKGDIIFFNGLTHEIALQFDFDENHIAKCVDVIYTDFSFFEVKSLKNIVATSQDHEEFRKLVAQYFFEHLLNRMYKLFGELAADAISHAFEELRTNKKINKEQEQYLKDKRKLTEEIKRMMGERSARGRGREVGSGAFKDPLEFKRALVLWKQNSFRCEPSCCSL